MGSAPFTARVESGRSVASIALSGELDLSAVPILEESLVRVEADGVTTIIVDLVELRFIGSIGLRVLIGARGRAFANGRQLLLLGAKPNVRRVFEVTGTEFLLGGEDARLFIRRTARSLAPSPCLTDLCEDDVLNADPIQWSSARKEEACLQLSEASVS